MTTKEVNKFANTTITELLEWVKTSPISKEDIEALAELGFFNFKKDLYTNPNTSEEAFREQNKHSEWWVAYSRMSAKHPNCPQGWLREYVECIEDPDDQYSFVDYDFETVINALKNPNADHITLTTAIEYALCCDRDNQIAYAIAVHPNLDPDDFPDLLEHDSSIPHTLLNTLVERGTLTSEEAEQYSDSTDEELIELWLTNR